ncbi:hypothetical protein, partial [Kitasatospora aureofaciens]|uniref:hypothetical protein n=1 Tax=Kitasatospora aureofaciens TaxID=1894 RepID=UPI00061DCD11
KGARRAAWAVAGGVPAGPVGRENLTSGRARAAEADRQELLRIAERVRAADLAAYDPRANPDTVEHPPLIRFRQT